MRAGALVFFFWKRVETSLARPVPSTGRIHLLEAEVPRFLRVSKHWRNAGLLRVKVILGMVTTISGEHLELVSLLEGSLSLSL